MQLSVTDTGIKVTVLAAGLDFPEGPAFDSQGVLWCVELKGGNLVRLENGVIARIPVQGHPNGIVIDARDRVWFCDSGLHAIRLYDPQTNTFTTLADEVDGTPLNKPNDLAFDKNGNLVFTCPGESRHEATGYVCVLTAAGEVKKIAENLFFPNGLAFSADGNELVIAETYRHRLWRGTWHAETATWSEAGPWALVGGPIGPDGMAFDTAGNLYVAVYGSRRIKKLNPAGLVVAEYALPGANPTNCAFNPAPPFNLVVTEAEQGLLVHMNLNRQGAVLFNGGQAWK